MKMGKRILGLALCLSLALSLLPATALAEERAETAPAETLDVTPAVETPALTAEEKQETPETVEETAEEKAQLAATYDMTYDVTGGKLYFDSTTGTITDCDAGVTEANIPSTIGGVSVTYIGFDAFSNCTNLISVSGPKWCC